MQVLRRGGDIHGEEAGEGKLHSMLSDSVGIVLEGVHGEEAWQKYTTYKVGVYRGGGGVQLPMWSPSPRC